MGYKSSKDNINVAACVVVIFLGSALIGGCPESKEPVEVKDSSGETAPVARPDDEVPVQMPADPAAVGALMDSMKGEADKVIAEMEARLEKGGDSEALFREGFRKIHKVMRPEFGPANAWLFNERGYKIDALCKKMGLTPERCQEIWEEELHREDKTTDEHR